MRLKLRRRFAMILIFLCLFWAVGIIWGLFTTLSFDAAKRLSMGSDRILEDRNGQTLQVLRVDFNKRKMPWFGLSDFSEALKRQLLQSEDKRFYYHPGFDPISFSRAVASAFTGGALHGASTLTMQIADLIDPQVLSGHAKIRKGSWRGKIQQFFKAIAIEIRWSKQQILEAYINEIHLKGEYQGIPAMAYAYFDKAPWALSDSESALITSLISAPNQKRERLRAKACHLLRSLGSIDCSTLDAPLNQLYETKPGLPQGPNEALHLARRLFKSKPNQEILRSTLDRTLQERVRETLSKNLTNLKNKNVHDMAAIVIDNLSGEVLSYIGNSTGYQEASEVDGVQAFRQAGSTLKPFIYAKALEAKTLTTASILLDEPTVISWSGGVYRPANYDRHFSGAVSVREALASSLNVPAVKIVTMLGLYETYELMQEIGLEKLKDVDFYGVSMALGAVDVQLDTLANAYRIFANQGLWTPLKFFADDHRKISRKVFSPEVSYLIQNILSDPNARSIGFGWDSPLETPFWTFVKTGTSKDYRDNWCVGASQRFTVGVWAGNFNSEAMHEVSGVAGAGPAWSEIMTYLHHATPSQTPEKPAGVVTASIRHPWQSGTHTEYFLKGTAPKNEAIEQAFEKRVQIVFPAQGSVLVKDPHLAEDRQALFVRFKGDVPKNSRIVLNDQPLGPAFSPFKIDNPPRGSHSLSIVSSDGAIITKIHFLIK